MVIILGERTADTVKIYFEKANKPEIKQVLPQKAKTVEEALTDYEKTLLPNATISFENSMKRSGVATPSIKKILLQSFQKGNNPL